MRLELRLFTGSENMHLQVAWVCDVNHVALKDLSGLNLAPFTFVPHASKNGEEIHAARQLVNSEGVKCYLCSDDDSLVLLEGQEQWQLFGEPVLVI